MPLILEPIFTEGGRAAPLPLQGLTVLVVEDSRFAAEAIRLMCQRLGARLRRAETLRAAVAHLAITRPDVVIVDLGLPDGRGEDLLRDLAARTPRPPVILGTSGAPDGRAAALEAGADGFLEKPIPGIAAFQEAILSRLPGRPAGEAGATPQPDGAALCDDLARAADLLRDDAENSAYVAGFLAGIARSLGDPALAGIARDVAAGGERMALIARLDAARAATEGLGGLQ
jgi:CheY-like chemotaxis protein